MLAQLSDENLRNEVMKIEGFTVDYVLKIMPATTEFAKRNRRLHIASLAVHWKLFVEDMINEGKKKHKSYVAVGRKYARWLKGFS